jgi:hypothetical protein
MTQKKRNIWKRPFGTSGKAAWVGFALLSALFALAAGLLITLCTVILRLGADIASLIGIFDGAPLRIIMEKILWLVELLLCGVLIVVTIAWGYQTAMHIAKPRQYSDRGGDDPIMRYLLATVAAIALVEFLKRMSA